MINLHCHEACIPVAAGFVRFGIDVCVLMPSVGITGMVGLPAIIEDILKLILIRYICNMHNYACDVENMRH